jgi:hypothetical protein
MLPNTQPDYATIHKHLGIIYEIELSFCDNVNKKIFKLRVFDKKRAQIEEVRLTDFDQIKQRYNTLIGSLFTDVEGLKNVRKIISDFTDKARTITFNDIYSSYHTDVYYK